MLVPDAPQDRIICYCFDIRLSDYLRDPALKEFVVEKTKAGLCSCKAMNPSGNCCLKDFPRID